MTPLEIDKLIQAKIQEIPVIDFDSDESTHHPIIINCLEREDVIISKEDSSNKDEAYKDEPSQLDVITKIFSILKPGEPIIVDNAIKDIKAMFYSEKRYDPALSAGIN